MEQTPQEIFQHHATALAQGDLDSLASDYAEDALVVTPTGEYRGRSAIRELYTGLLDALPQVTLDLEAAVFADNLLLIQWRADSAVNTVSDGVDTLFFESGFIKAQTISCTLTPKSLVSGQAGLE